jgi:hypothetical protein
MDSTYERHSTDLSPEEIRSVKCPRCGAEPGEACTRLADDNLPVGDVIGGTIRNAVVHLVRVDLAKQGGA